MRSAKLKKECVFKSLVFLTCQTIIYLLYICIRNPSVFFIFFTLPHVSTRMRNGGANKSNSHAYLYVPEVGFLKLLKIAKSFVKLLKELTNR
jgi:hypothetical protein